VAKMVLPAETPWYTLGNATLDPERLEMSLIPWKMRLILSYIMVQFSTWSDLSFLETVFSCEDNKTTTCLFLSYSQDQPAFNQFQALCNAWHLILCVCVQITRCKCQNRDPTRIDDAVIIASVGVQNKYPQDINKTLTSYNLWTKQR
jgi:hypothetical protein